MTAGGYRKYGRQRPERFESCLILVSGMTCTRYGGTDTGTHHYFYVWIFDSLNSSLNHCFRHALAHLTEIDGNRKSSVAKYRQTAYRTQ